MSELEIPIEYYVREFFRNGNTHHPPFQICLLPTFTIIPSPKTAKSGVLGFQMDQKGRKNCNIIHKLSGKI